MQKIDFFDRLVINSRIQNEDGSIKIFLADAKNIVDVVINDGRCAYLYELDDNGIMSLASEVISKNKFANVFEEYDSVIHEGRETFLFYNYESDEPKLYVKADWVDFPHHRQLISEHGVKQTAYYITDSEILSGVCFRSNYCVPRNYPYHEHKEFFKFVANNGKSYYVRMTFPFFPDDFDYSFDLIFKEDFDEFD